MAQFRTTVGGERTYPGSQITTPVDCLKVVECRHTLIRQTLGSTKGQLGGNLANCPCDGGDHDACKHGNDG